MRGWEWQELTNEKLGAYHLTRELTHSNFVDLCIIVSASANQRLVLYLLTNQRPVFVVQDAKCFNKFIWNCVRPRVCEALNYHCVSSRVSFVS